MAAPAIDRYLAELPAAELDPSLGAAGVVGAVRRYLDDVHGYLFERMASGASGQEINEEHSDAVDRLLRRLFALAEQEFYAGGEEYGHRLAVVAVGGYARREMSLRSDVDLLFLHPGRVDPYVSRVSERLQYWLWDGGLPLGAATRTPRDSLALARRDLTVATALLDARFLVGDVDLFHEFREAVRRDVARDARGFVERLLRGWRERHEKFGDSLYLLQPNLKEGAGGLRDYHTAHWITCAAHPSVRGLADFLHFGLLTESEMAELRAGLDFLWRVRNQLHRIASHKTDQMSFELQEQLAEVLGYAERPGPELPVERFMQAYYRHARAVETFSEIVIEQSAARARGGRRPVARPLEGGFRRAGDQLEIPHAAFLREQPLRLLEAFLVAGRHDLELSRTARRLIRENLDLVDDRFRGDPEASRLFQEILAAEQRVTRNLLVMNEVGLLGRYLPEWEHIVCRWQHVVYHTYTVDVHSIFLVETLRRLRKGEFRLEVPDLTELSRDIRDPVVLFLGCLLHDVGKGRGGGHSRKGAVLARACCERLGLESERTEQVVFLVAEHLQMSHVAQRRDLSDPKLVVDFARRVGTRDNLRNLYLLTFADMKASSRSAWTGWRRQLLRELFERTSEFLETGGGDLDRAARLIEGRVEQRKAAAREVLQRAGTSQEEIDAFFESMPRRYFVSHTPPQIARHAQVLLAYSRDRVVSTAVREMRGGFSEFIACAADVPGLYANVAGVLTARGINILGSHVYTTRGGLALEIYRVSTPEGGELERREAWRSVESMLQAVLTGVVDVRELVARRRSSLLATRSPASAPPTVHITNEESDFYTIVDVSADDRRGLLYDLTRTIHEQGFEIFVSKATTVLDQVADTFYLKDRDGRKVTDPERLAALREALLRVAGAGGGPGGERGVAGP